MYKTIFPQLVSLETPFKKIPGFSLSEDFDFYPSMDSKAPFHFKVVLSSSITIPKTYDLRSGNFFSKDHIWYYHRKFSGLFQLNFSYNPQNKELHFNKGFSLVRDLLGFFSIGRILTEIITLDLFLSGYDVLRGCSFSLNNKNYAIVSPGMNGKTTLAKTITVLGGKYIAEDLLVINKKTKTLYPTPFKVNNYGRKPNQDYKTLPKDKIIAEPVMLHHAYFSQNHTSPTSDPTKISPTGIFLNCSLFFLHNPFARAMLLDPKIADQFQKQLSDIPNLLSLFSPLYTTNFNYAERLSLK